VKCPRKCIEIFKRILLYIEVKLVGDPPAIIIQPPQQVEENIYEKEKKYDLLEATDEISPVEFLSVNGPGQLERFEKDHHD
jgi:hypothetical protein